MMLRRYHDHHKPDTESGEDSGPDAERPARSAHKADWIVYAVAQGADEADADKATKEQLIEQYGG
ncbi:hypothetical protein ACIQUU_32085 [Streptomyces sp. NPDC101116]|uniref:hypothetical protein n=1 Tax=Streptomyces sp. NPDC101116 TaxID=3366107 RepID=UPI00382908CC